MTPSEASKLIIEMSDALEKLQQQVDGLATSLERLQGKVEALGALLKPPPADEA